LIEVIQLHNWQKQIYYNFCPPFLIYYFSLSFVAAAWLVDQQWRISRAVRLARAANSHRICPDRAPPGRAGFRVSRDLVGVSCISRSRRGSSYNVSCVSRSSLEALGKVFVLCRHRPTWGSARLIFGPSIPSNLARHWCDDLISVNRVLWSFFSFLSIMRSCCQKAKQLELTNKVVCRAKVKKLLHWWNSSLINYVLLVSNLTKIVGWSVYKLCKFTGMQYAPLHLLILWCYNWKWKWKCAPLALCVLKRVHTLWHRCNWLLK